MGAFDLKNSSVFITFDNLENGMIDSTTQSKVELKCGDATFYAKTGDVYICCVPDRAKIVDERINSHQKKMANTVAKLVRHFDGKHEKCTLPKYTQDTHAAYSVAAAGASDWAKQLLIYGTFKSAFDIMGLSVEAQALAMGCPDVGTIAKWEFRLAVVL
jgi:hypothetical protein